MTRDRIRAPLLVLSVVAYVAACLTPALIFRQAGSADDPMPGWNVLAVGWMGMFLNQFGWFGNLFWIAGMICGLFKFFRVGRMPQLSEWRSLRFPI